MGELGRVLEGRQSKVIEQGMSQTEKKASKNVRSPGPRTES
jgi:hypothetical protein